MRGTSPSLEAKYNRVFNKNKQEREKMKFLEKIETICCKATKPLVISTVVVFFTGTLTATIREIKETRNKNLKQQ